MATFLDGSRLREHCASGQCAGALAAGPAFSAQRRPALAARRREMASRLQPPAAAGRSPGLRSQGHRESDSWLPGIPAARFLRGRSLFLRLNRKTRRAIPGEPRGPSWEVSSGSGRGPTSPLRPQEAVTTPGLGPALLPEAKAECFRPGPVQLRGSPAPRPQDPQEESGSAPGQRGSLE